MLSPTIARTFRDAERHLGTMSADAAASLLSAAADLALIMDLSGTVLDMAFSGTELTGERADAWIGGPLIDVVADDSRSKVEALFNELANSMVSRRREINFVGQTGEGLPMNCVAIRLADQERIVFFGRDMRGLARLQQRLVSTQISMEREYDRLRQAEACYRVLFQLVGEAVLIIDASTMAVSDANPVAAELLGIPITKIVGRRATHVFGAKDREAVRAMLVATQASGRTEISGVGFERSAAGMHVKASLFRQSDVSYILLRLLPVADNGEPAVASARGDDALAVIERLPDGFVLVDEQRRVKRANAAFLEMVQVAGFDQLRDAAIDSWFERSSVDAGVLIANVREHGMVRRFPTVLRGSLGASEDVEITAVCVPGDKGFLYGLILRRSVRAPSDLMPGEGLPARSAEQFTDLIGHMALKEVVRETTDVVERLCIEAALKLTGDNRASAAQMLGVSRQSLYAKMRRFGVGDLSGDGGADQDES